MRDTYLCDPPSILSSHTNFYGGSPSQSQPYPSTNLKSTLPHGPQDTPIQKMAPIHTLNGILDPPPNSRESVKARYCPGMRSCWNFNLTTFNPLNRDRADTIRRICMLVALGCHTAFDLLTLFLLTITFNAVGLFVTLIISLIGFFFLAGCLATIGNAEGERIVFGKTVVSLDRSSNGNRSELMLLSDEVAFRCVLDVLRLRLRCSVLGILPRHDWSLGRCSRIAAPASMDPDIPCGVGCYLGHYTGPPLSCLDDARR